MKDMWFRLKAYLKYCFTARHRRGFGIHSPYVYHLLNFVIFEEMPFYAFRPIERLRQMLLESNRKIYVTDYGTGKSGERYVSDIAQNSLESPQCGQLLFRLVNYYHPDTILELGTSLGISTLYLAKPQSGAKVITMEGADNVADIAQLNFEKMGVKNVEIVRGDIDKNLQHVVDGVDYLDFVYIDANHTYLAVKKYFNICLQKSTNRSIFVLDDIHHSEEMEKAWNELKDLPIVHLSIDLFHMGLLVLEKDIPKQDYVVAF